MAPQDTRAPNEGTDHDPEPEHPEPQHDPEPEHDIEPVHGDEPGLAMRDFDRARSNGKRTASRKMTQQRAAAEPPPTPAAHPQQRSSRPMGGGTGHNHRSAVLVNIALLLLSWSTLGPDANGSPAVPGGAEASATGASSSTTILAGRKREELTVEEVAEETDWDESVRVVDGGGNQYEIEKYRTFDPYAVVDKESRRLLEENEEEGIKGGEDVILIATVDGTIAGLSRTTGKTLWKQKGSDRGRSGVGGAGGSSDGGEVGVSEEGEHHMRPNVGRRRENHRGRDGERDALLSPLVSTTTTTKSASGSGEWRTAAVPSVDGKVYLTPGRDTSGHHGANTASGPSASSSASSSSTRDVTATTSVRELVSHTPFVDGRGRFYVGSRRATVAALDRDTGEIVRIVGEGGGDNGQGQKSNLDGRDVVWVGRVDYSVSVYDARSGELDVEFSTSEVLSVKDMARGNGLDGEFVEGEDTVDEVGAAFRRDHPVLMLPSSGGGSSSANDEGTMNEGDASASSSSFVQEAEATAGLPSVLVATPNGNVALRDPITGKTKWVANETFDTAVAFAVESASGASLGVDIVPDAPVPSDSSDYLLSGNYERQIASSSNMDKDDRQVGSGIGHGGVDNNAGNDKSTARDNDTAPGMGESIVGALSSGQLFALPLGQRSRGRRGQPNKYALPLGLPHPHSAAGSTRQLKSKLPDIVRQPSQKGNLQDLSSHQHQGSADHHQAAVSTVNSKTCAPKSPNFPACLKGMRFPQEGMSDFSQAFGSSFAGDSAAHGHDSGAATAVTTTTDGNQPQVAHHNYQYHHKGGGSQKQRSKFQTFLRIMSSWVPPAVALAFVVSFEVGRRERLKADANSVNGAFRHQAGTLSNGHSFDASSFSKRASSSLDEGALALLDDDNVKGERMENESNNDSNPASSVRHVGVIQVTEEVLGYGGHGTVVYKGKLDGRNVAVKRMLKAYHASADREISLLIESDGHPNVVRYFLKEARGDFVYLALELCDMSLHDLIVALSKRRVAAMGTPRKDCTNDAEDVDEEGGAPGGSSGQGVSHATKTMLLQIASGVRHLHSLRIVHRDLKPANILLAQRTRASNGNACDALTLYSAFEHDEYTPKISDMGLGKQLAGQSSFGLSTLGNPSIPGPSGACKDAGSNLVGAGPGSVGWQAPEVMAMRWSPEQASATSAPSFAAAPIGDGEGAGEGGTEGRGSESIMVEASPIDVAANNARTSRSVDIFSLGCIFYCTILPGSHPFGEWYEREANIMKNRPDTDSLEDVSVDAADLVKSMINRDPKCRPSAALVCDHPFFWSPSKRLMFLCDVSDRLEAAEVQTTAASPANGEATATAAPSSSCSLNVDVFSIERNAVQVVGTAWDKDLDPDLITNVSKFRTYDPSSVRDCLRLIRNKHHHYDELPLDVRKRMGSNPDGLLQYFERKFPRLLMHCYNVCCDSLAESNDAFALKYGLPSSSSRMAGAKVLKNRVSSVGTESEYSPRSVVKKNGSVADKVGKSLPTQPNDTEESTTKPKPSSEVLEKENEPGKEEGPSKDEIGANDSTVQDDWRNLAKKDEALLSHDGTVAVKNASPVSHSPPSSPKLPPQAPDDDDKITTTTQQLPPSLGGSSTNVAVEKSENPVDMVIWAGSTASKTFQCRGWMRSDDEWKRRTDVTFLRKRDANVARCADDPKFRTRLCNHWDASGGTFCPMKKKNKCIFAHGPVELRVKEGKRNRWGRLVDKNGNNSNPLHSGGEDTYGTARSIESMRREEGKWNPDRGPNNQGGKGGGGGRSRGGGRQGGGGGRKR